jgi:hypothetical protein
VVALLVIMRAVLLQGSSQRTLPKENEPRPAFFFNRSYPTLGLRSQVNLSEHQARWNSRVFMVVRLVFGRTASVPKSNCK